MFMVRITLQVFIIISNQSKMLPLCFSVWDATLPKLRSAMPEAKNFPDGEIETLFSSVRLCKYCMFSKSKIYIYILNSFPVFNTFPLGKPSK